MGVHACCFSDRVHVYMLQPEVNLGCCSSGAWAFETKSLTGLEAGEAGQPARHRLPVCLLLAVGSGG